MRRATDIGISRRLEGPPRPLGRRRRNFLCQGADDYRPDQIDTLLATEVLYTLTVPAGKDGVVGVDDEVPQASVHPGRLDHDAAVMPAKTLSYPAHTRVVMPATKDTQRASATGFSTRTSREAVPTRA